MLLRVPAHLKLTHHHLPVNKGSEGRKVPFAALNHCATPEKYTRSDCRECRISVDVSTDVHERKQHDSYDLHISLPRLFTLKEIKQTAQCGMNRGPCISQALYPMKL